MQICRRLHREFVSSLATVLIVRDFADCRRLIPGDVGDKTAISSDKCVTSSRASNDLIMKFPSDYPRRARSAIGVDIVFTLDVRLYVSALERKRLIGMT